MIIRLLIVFLLWGFCAQAQQPPVPVVKDTTKRTKVDGAYYYLFTVKQGQTVFSIAKAYSVSVDDINNANADVKANGVKSGQTIKIPAEKGVMAAPPAKEMGDEFIPSTIADSASLKILTEACRKAVKKEEYTVAMFLPIYSHQNNFSEKYTVGSEFYEGVLMGIEDYKDAKIKLKIEVFDTENDTIQIKEILAKTNLKKYDLVVGPLFASAFHLVAKQAVADSVVCVSPFSQIFKVVNGLPNVHKLTPSAVTIIDQCAQYIATKHGRQNVIFVTNSNKKDAGTMALYRKRMEAAFGQSNLVFKEFTYTGAAIPEGLLTPMGENFFVFPASDQAQVGMFINNLYNLSTRFNVKVFGLNQWQNYDNLPLDKLERLQLHYARTSFIDRERKDVEDINRRCREKYKIDAGEYFLQGYDIITFYIAMLEKYGTGLMKCVLCEKELPGKQTDIRMGATNNGNGLENIAIQIMKYDGDNIIVAN